MLTDKHAISAFASIGLVLLCMNLGDLTSRMGGVTMGFRDLGLLKIKRHPSTTRINKGFVKCTGLETWLQPLVGWVCGPM